MGSLSASVKKEDIVKRFVAALVLAAAGVVFAAEGPATQPVRVPGNVHIRFRPGSSGYSVNPGAMESRGEDAVSCVLQIDSDNSRGESRADAQMAQALLNTTALQDGAIARMLAKNPEVRGRFTV